MQAIQVLCLETITQGHVYLDALMTMPMHKCKQLIDYVLQDACKREQDTLLIKSPKFVGFPPPVKFSIMVRMILNFA